MFKKFSENDLITTKGIVEEQIVLKPVCFLHYPNFENHYTSEAIGPSGSYFMSLYDSPVPPKNKVATVAFGYFSASSSFAITTEVAQKQTMYRLYAKKLLGDENLNFIIDGQPRYELLFVSIARNQMKDSIKRNTFNVGFLSNINSIHPTQSTAPINYFCDLSTKTKIDETIAGNYGNLYSVGSKNSNQVLANSGVVGLIFYEHGTAVLIPHKMFETASNAMSPTGELYRSLAESKTQMELLSGFSNKIADISFTNKSTPAVSIFNCVVDKDEFNYSTNPSFKNDKGEIRVNSGSGITSGPFTAITQVGLVNEQGELIAVGKLSEPIKKSFDKKVSIKVKLIQ
jgi:hypothetical protein